MTLMKPLLFLGGVGAAGLVAWLLVRRYGERMPDPWAAAHAREALGEAARHAGGGDRRAALDYAQEAWDLAETAGDERLADRARNMKWDLVFAGR